MQNSACACLRKHRLGRDFIYIDEVGDPIVDGDFVLIPMFHCGEPCGTQVWKTERLYEALGVVSANMLPSMMETSH